MKTTIICLTFALVLPALSLPADAEEAAPNRRIALAARLACPAVREAVKLYGEYAAEQWARGHGVSETKIEQAKRCLR